MSVGKRRAPLRSSGPPERRTRVKPRNAARRVSEFARCYHSKERVAFVKSLPCAACGVVGYSENAHVLGNGGMGRKAGYDTVAPLCGQRFSDDGWFQSGCHRTFDTMRSVFRILFPKFRAKRAALKTEAAWSAHLHQQTGAGTT